MTRSERTSTVFWLTLLLGAYHGLNPGMGWLFAVALGMQEQKASAVAKSLVPIALGHAAAIGSVVLTAAFLGMTLPVMASATSSPPSWSASLEIIPPGGTSAPALGPYAGRLPRPDRLVVSYGLGSWRRSDGSAGAAGAATVSKHTGRIAGHSHISPTASPLAGMLATGVQTVSYLAIKGLLALGLVDPRSASRFSVQRGSISTWSGQPRW